MENSRKQFIINLSVCIASILILLILDIVTKLVVLNYFNGIEGASIEVIDNFFFITLVFNTGAAFGSFAGTAAGRVILALFSVVGSIVSIYFLIKKFNTLPILYRIALYLFIPGCTGNLIDRVGIYQTEGVIDFLHFRFFNKYDFAVFNVADICLTCSIIMFIVAIIFTKDHHENKNTISDDVERDIKEQLNNEQNKN